MADKGIRISDNRVQIVSTSLSPAALSFVSPGHANAKSNGGASHRDFQDVLGIENLRNQITIEAQNATEKDDGDSQPEEKELGVWFTKLPKSFVIPQDDLLNIFGLPRDFKKQYDLDTQDVLGEGAYGTVFKAVRKGTNTPVAVKVLYKRIHKKKQRPADARYLCRLKNELEMMQTMGKGTFAVGYQDAYEDDDNLYIVMELCNGPTLKHYIRTKSLNEQHACTMVEQVLKMLASWHSEGCMHCDMKPANLLLMQNDLDNIHVKATDFGLAHKFNPGTKHHKKQGTKVYMAPEMLLKRYDEKADLWSVGVITYQLLTGRLPFCRHDAEIRRLRAEDLEERILSYKIDVVDSPVWDNISSDAKDFVLKMLERNPAQRLSAYEALNHPWIRKNSKTMDPLDRIAKRSRFSIDDEIECEEERIAA